MVDSEDGEEIDWMLKNNHYDDVSFGKEELVHVS